MSFVGAEVESIVLPEGLHLVQKHRRVGAER